VLNQRSQGNGIALPAGESRNPTVAPGAVGRFVVDGPGSGPESAIPRHVMSYRAASAGMMLRAA